MARMPLSDDALDRLVASRDPIDSARLHDPAIGDSSRRVRDELLVELACELSSRPRVPRDRRQRWVGTGRWRMAAVAGLAVAALVGGLAMVGSLLTGGGHDGPLDVPAASAAVVLDRAAQAAMRSTSVVAGRGQYGFVKVETGTVLGLGSAVGPQAPSWSVWVRLSQVKTDWYGADGSGRERVVRTSTSFLTGRDRAIALAHGMTLAKLTVTSPRVIDGAFASRGAPSVGLLPYWQIGRLPTQPATLRRALDRLILASDGGPGRASLRRQLQADPAGLFGPISQFLFLPTSPQLRAALFRVLAHLPGVQLLGHQRDRLGRSGIAVAITHGAPDRVREELLFDPATSNLLQTQTVLLHTSSASRGPSMPAGTVVEYADFLTRGVVDSITQLPGGPRLPLKPAGGSR